MSSQIKGANAISDLGQQRKMEPWTTQHRAESSHMKKSGTTLHSLKHGTLPWRNMKHTTAQTRAGKGNHSITPPCPFLSLFLFSSTHPIYHSWYNVPPKKKVEHDNPQPDQSDSQPVDFASFVPTHDPSLSAALPTVEPDPTAQLLISQDEAFRRAVQASYWSGYWTAIYNVCLSLALCKHANILQFHRQSQMTQPETNGTEDYDISSSDEEQVEELLSMQQ